MRGSSEYQVAERLYKMGLVYWLHARTIEATDAGRDTLRQERKMAKPWQRPPGCECDASEPARHKCSTQWMRCNARIAYVMRNLGVPTRVKVREKRPR